MVFGRDGASRIDADVVRAGFTALGERTAHELGAQLAVETLAVSFLEVAVEAMANAIREVSTRQGLDAAAFTLFCFGGAAGQHVCRVARAAGVRQVLVHPLASVLSAFGIGVAATARCRKAGMVLMPIMATPPLFRKMRRETFMVVLLREPKST